MNNLNKFTSLLFGGSYYSIVDGVFTLSNFILGTNYFICSITLKSHKWAYWGSNYYNVLEPHLNFHRNNQYRQCSECNSKQCWNKTWGSNGKWVYTDEVLPLDKENIDVEIFTLTQLSQKEIKSSDEYKKKIISNNRNRSIEKLINKKT